MGIIARLSRDHVCHHPSLRASREDRRRHHRQGRQRQVHDDLAPARQQDVRDLLLLAAALRRRNLQASAIPVNNGWTPCIEFEDSAHAYTDGHGWANMDTSINAGYYDNRYWVMWKLPMYGSQNPDEVIAEINTCIKCFPDCYVRVAGFDNIKQVQCSAFLAHRPASEAACAVDQRQVQG